MKLLNFVCLLLFVQRVLTVMHFNKSCYKQIKGNVCFKMNSNYCLDGYLNYHYSANIFSNLFDVNSIERYLEQWKYLRSIPKCWRVMRQPLCTVFFPKCHFNISSGFSHVLLPSKELCNLRKDHCSLMTHIWPDYLQCEHSHFVEKCFKEMTYTVSYENVSTCPSSLKPSKDARQWYAGFEECSLPCLSVFFNKHQHFFIKIITILFGVACLLANLFVMLTFMINWKHLNEFPDNVILYLNFCFCIATLAWLLPQFLSTDNSITCNQDGTPISTEPYTRDSSWCLINFLCMHFCTLASFLWLLILTYTWQLSFKKSRREVRSRQVVFHLGVWSVSIVFTILTVTFTSISGDASKRICSVNHHDHLSRSFFIILPPFIFTAMSLVFLIKGMLSLKKMRMRLVDQVLLEKRKKMKNSIVRIGVFSFFLTIFCLLSLSLHAHRVLNDNSWQQSLRNYIICTSNIHKIVDHPSPNLSSADSYWNIPNNNNNGNNCYFESKPSIGLLVLEILNFFGTGVLFSSWLWRCAVMRTWKTFFLRLLTSVKSLKFFKRSCEDNTKESLKNSSKGNNDNRTSILSTCSSIQTDLIGMNFDISSMTSLDVSSLSSIFSSKTNQCSESEVSSSRRFKRSFLRFHHRNRKELKSRLHEQQMKQMGGVKTSSISSSDWSTGELSCELSRGRSCDLQDRLEMAFPKEEGRMKIVSDGGRLSSAVSDVVSNHKEECLIKSTDKTNLKNFLTKMNNTKNKSMDRSNRSSSYPTNKNEFKSSIDGSISSRLQSSSFSSISQPLSSNSASLRNFVASNTTDTVENHQNHKNGHNRSLSASMATTKIHKGYTHRHKESDFEVEVPINDNDGSEEIKLDSEKKNCEGQNDVDSDKEESLDSSNSNFTVASSDEDALSIQSDEKETTPLNFKQNEILTTPDDKILMDKIKNDARDFFNNFHTQKFYESMSKEYLQNYRQQQAMHHVFQQHSLYLQFLQQQECHPPFKPFQHSFPPIPESFPRCNDVDKNPVNNDTQPNNISSFNESFNSFNKNNINFPSSLPLTHSLPNQYSSFIPHSHPFTHFTYMHPFYPGYSFYPFNPPSQNITSTNFQSNTHNGNNSNNINSQNDNSNKELKTHNNPIIDNKNPSVLSQKQEPTNGKGIKEEDGITTDEMTKFKLLNHVEVFSDEDDNHDEEEDEISKDDESMHSSSSAMSIIDEKDKSFIEPQFVKEDFKDKSSISIHSPNSENVPTSDIPTDVFNDNTAASADNVQKSGYSSVEERRKKKRHERYKRLVAVQNKKKNLE